ncbi:SafA/ExsA family spore coat assembly protein [Effusibacillus lacus]|uniref:LysM domain-containing protein n=1 Tax=Effusibacillus lacus TaxID=1348429 RepID=A0A292YEE7_9BACL|nr:SafA/ExsA family spore coat assembly protein [Effusibacillus lacus]TCS68949.1 spore coat assembly protein SafA [Effusibacillus lacus]GAX91482.1 hypothetical protein EFBL_3151 [Effusibacillus lacus]
MKVHNVQKGDTLWKIAKMYGVPLAQVIAANPQIADPDKIDVGMKVNVPVATEGIVTSDIPTPEGMNVEKYVVQSGDTLWKIAKKTGHSLASIIAANPQIANPDMIMPGQVINIPVHGMDSVLMGPGMHTKEMMTMPKAKMTEVKPIVTAPIPQPAPAPIPVEGPDYHYHLMMLEYHPQYFMQPPVKVEIKQPPKPKMKPMEKPVMTKPCMKVPCPPVYYNPCPPGTYPFLMDECGNLYPYPMYPHGMPYHHSPMHHHGHMYYGPAHHMMPGVRDDGYLQSVREWQAASPALPKPMRGEDGPEAHE